MSIRVHDAKTHFSRLLERAHAGEEIVIAKAGKPYARLVPMVPPAPEPKLRILPTPGGWPGTGDIPDSVWFDPMPEEEFALWEGKPGDLV